MHSPFPWITHPQAPNNVFDADGKRIASAGINPFVDPETAADNAALIAAIPAMVEALALQEAAEEAHANCEECGREDVPELCPICFPLYDDARVARRAVLASIGKTP